jgi:O-antigen/teichoic acid export membrane protein
MLSNAAVGYFSTADKFAILIGIIPAVITQTMSPLLVKARAGNPELYRLRSRQFVGTVLWLTIGLAVGGSVLSYPLIALTFGQQYLPAVPVLRVLAFRAVGMALSTTSGQLIIIEGIQKWAFARNILGCVVCVVLNFILIPEFGAVGSAWASVITVVFTGCVANLLIPPYHAVLRLQLQAIATGWRGILSLRRLLP